MMPPIIDDDGQNRSLGSAPGKAQGIEIFTQNRNQTGGMLPVVAGIELFQLPLQGQNPLGTSLHMAPEPQSITILRGFQLQRPALLQKGTAELKQKSSQIQPRLPGHQHPLFPALDPGPRL